MRAEINQGDNYNPRLNFARIEERAYFGQTNHVTGDAGKSGDNSMFSLADDICEGNTSQSHEMGHGYGNTENIDHVSQFQRFEGVPNIMTTILTLVDGEYTVNGKRGELNPNNPKDVPLNPLNQYKRKVTQDNIRGMNINQYGGRGKSNGLGNGFRVGNSTNKLFNKEGKCVGCKSQSSKTGPNNDPAPSNSGGPVNIEINGQIQTYGGSK